jgi:hypothetical protein
MPVVRDIIRDARRTGYTFSSILFGIVESVPFQMRMKAVDVESPPPDAQAVGQ